MRSGFCSVFHEKASDLAFRKAWGQDHYPALRFEMPDDELLGFSASCVWLSVPLSRKNSVIPRSPSQRPAEAYRESLPQKPRFHLFDEVEELLARVDAQLGVGSAQVGFHGVLGQHEVVGDVAGAASGGELAYDLDFPI